MNSQRQEQLRIAEQAAGWVRVLDNNDPQQSAEFLKWLRMSPIHVREFMLASRLDDALNVVDPEHRINLEALLKQSRSNVLPIGAHVTLPAAQPAPKAQPRRRFDQILFRAVAGVVCAVMLASAAWLVYQRDAQRTYTTEVGEQRSFQLEDGSVVFLNTHSHLQVRYSKNARDIHLSEGQALFEVRHDPSRPFRVHAGSAVVEAIGTQFDVYLATDRAKVAVVEGIVQVTANETTDGATSSSERSTPATARIVAGEGTSVGANGQIQPIVKVDAETITAWRDQRLEFRDIPLSEIASEFNRYNSAPQLRVEGEAGTRRFFGSFNARRPESLLAYLSQEGDLIFERRGNEVVIRALER